MTRATALFTMVYPGREEAKSISLENGRKLGCRVFSDTVYTVGTYRQGPLYEWFYLVPTVTDGMVTDVITVDREGNPDADRQKEWDTYAEYIITLLPDSRKKKLELLITKVDYPGIGDMVFESVLQIFQSTPLETLIKYRNYFASQHI